MYKLGGSIAQALALGATLSAGCALEDGDVEPLVEGQAQELVGGIATTARPEIGTFNNGAGGGCTATLIAPRLVLTAAHCLSPAYTATAPVAGAAFQFTDASGVARSYAVDRVRSFASKRFEYIPAGGFTTDLALLHLANAVPPSQAVPAELALQEPVAGSTATIFGFGCTDRTPASGGGFKQYVTFSFGNATRALCWGDSGGPVVAGAVGGGGAIWGVNSDFNFVGGTDDWTDIFAAVPFYRKQLEALARGWDGANEIGIDRTGMDYAALSTASAAACRTSCQNDATCRAFTWVPGGSAGTCWLKSGVPEPRPAANNGVVSGLASLYEPGINRGGSDYAAPSAPSAESCAAMCARDNACQAYTFVSSGASGTCWMKNAVPAVSSCANCISGVIRREAEVGYNRPGYDYAVSSAASAQACADTCVRDDKCEAYTYTGFTGNNCWLKDAVPWAGAGAGMTSGVRRGLELDTNRAGGDYRSFTTTRLSPTVCQATCAQESACQAWTYVPPSSSASVATCWLKSSIPGRSTAVGIVSGVRGFELLP